MKITITKQELLDIINSRLNSAGMSFTDVQVVSGGKPVARLDAKGIENELCRKVGIEYVCPPDKKIAAIKALREIVPGMGLAEAKNAIENWANWIETVGRTGKVPRF